MRGSAAVQESLFMVVKLEEFVPGITRCAGYWSCSTAH
jgi:hypothetical protein